MINTLFEIADNNEIRNFLNEHLGELKLEELDIHWDSITDEGKEALLHHLSEIIENLYEINSISNTANNNNSNDLEYFKQKFMDHSALVVSNRNLLIDMFILNIKKWTKDKWRKIKNAVFKASTSVLNFVKKMIVKLSSWLRLQSWSLSFTGGYNFGSTPGATLSSSLTFTFAPPLKKGP